ncbi:MAG: 5'-nucleotidase [Crenarchaeota archaeon]|nr:5'-nucleotidase [Thermoproteota archaeon]
MPIFVSDEQKFLEIARRATECRIKRLEKEGKAKIKARTKRYLYTYIVPLERLDEVLAKVREVCKNVVEL